MPITQSLCNSFKLEMLSGIHEAAHTYKIALFTDAATLNKNTTSYLGLSDEVVGLGYTAGGIALVGFSLALINDTATLDWTTDPVWPTSTITARGALIYNDSLPGKNAIAVISFGMDFVSTNGNFTIVFPPPGETTAFIRII